MELWWSSIRVIMKCYFYAVMGYDLFCNIIGDFDIAWANFVTQWGNRDFCKHVLNNLIIYLIFGVVPHWMIGKLIACFVFGFVLVIFSMNFEKEIKRIFSCRKMRAPAWNQTIVHYLKINVLTNSTNQCYNQPFCHQLNKILLKWSL